MNNKPLLLCLMLGLLTAPAMAGSVFTVDKISVDATAESTSKARAKALRQGQRQALRLVMRRLTKQEEWGVLPAVGALNVDELVEGFRISDEKTGPGRYLARLSVQFKPAPMRRTLLDAGVSVTEVQSQPYLLLPVLEDGQGLLAWGENWWRDSWLAQDIDNNPAPLTLPLGDLQDTSVATAEDILIGNPDKLAQLNQKYGTETVVVAHGLADIEGQLGVTIYIFGPTDSDVIVRTYRSGEDHDVLAERAVSEVLSLLAERWKLLAAVTSDETTALLIRTEFSSLRDWTSVLARLGDAKLVRDVSIREVTPQYGYVSVNYIGSSEQLVRNLSQQGLTLSENEDGWLMTGAAR